MAVFDQPEFDQHQHVAFHYDPKTRLRAIIAVHRFGPGRAFGGIRMLPYASDAEALRDVLRLSRGMSYKAAAARLPVGGAKSVIIGDPVNDKTEAALERFGEILEQMGGRYIAGEDVNIGVQDVAVIQRRTHFVQGRAEAGGNPARITAMGVFRGIQAAVRHVYEKSDLHGMKIALQGVGSAGAALAALLARAGAEMTISDSLPQRAAIVAERVGATVVDPHKIYDVDAHVFSPNALGAAINWKTVHRLKVRIVAGAANNQLATPQDGMALHNRGIVFVPDYLINCGGLLNVYAEVQEQYAGVCYNEQSVLAQLEAVQDRTFLLLRRAAAANVPPEVLCDEEARAFMNAEATDGIQMTCNAGTDAGHRA